MCSYYADTFEEIEKFLVLNIYACSYIKGSAKHIAKTVDRYNAGIVRVLFLHSKYSAAGLNLNTTTDIILMHKTLSMDRTQIIGRAQRPIRTSVLVVHECTPTENLFIN